MVNFPSPVKKKGEMHETYYDREAGIKLSPLTHDLASACRSEWHAPYVLLKLWFSKRAKF